MTQILTCGSFPPVLIVREAMGLATGAECSKQFPPPANSLLTQTIPLINDLRAAAAANRNERKRILERRILLKPA
jgi:hypothetical protein